MFITRTIICVTTFDTIINLQRKIGIDAEIKQYRKNKNIMWI